VTGAALRRARLLVASLALAQALAPTTAAAQVPAPDAHFGFRMGADRQLAGAEDIEKYFELVAARTNRVKVVDIGRKTEGRRTIAAIVSAPENIQNLNEIRAVNQRLADPRTVPPEEARRLAASHKAIVAIGASIHASEIGGSQAASELLYSLATSNEPETLDVLRNIVLILIPSLNPDGHRLVVDWYDKTKNTTFEGAPMPWLYHTYAGHDLNRDAFMMNLAESRNLSRFFYTEWHPQVFLSMHQTGSNGPRMFVPPIADPIDRNYDPIIWREASLLGGAMALELQHDGRAGVMSNAVYDYFWPGYEDSAPLGHNTVCLLTEVAGVSLATPVTVPTAELTSPGGLAPTLPLVSFPDPWPGGRWSLRDIVEYDLSAARGLLYAVAAYRERIVGNFYDMGARAVEAGRRGGPFAFVVPGEQHDPRAAAKLEELLLQGSIEIHRALEPFQAGDGSYPAGTDIILLAQPYRAYVKTLLERQDYPGRRPSRDAPAERPYDVAGWTLPAQMGVDVRAIDRPFEVPVTSRVSTATIRPNRVWGERKPSYYVIDAPGNSGALAINRLIAAGANVSWTSSDLEVDGYTYAPGSLVVASAKSLPPLVEAVAAQLGLRATGTKRKPAVDTTAIGAKRIGLYKPWVENADEGWTRWLLEQYEFRYETVTDADARAGDLRRQFDAIILPSASRDQLISGNQAGSVPTEYVGGLGETGVAALKVFVESGGTLICLDQACALVITELKLPIRDVAHDASSDEFYCPGSIVKVDLEPRQPVAYGMEPHTAGFFAFSSAYEVTGANGSARVIARYGPKDLLLSGWLEGEQVIASRPAAIEVTVGLGRVVLLGFPVQHRAQSLATFRLLFNSIFTAR
jgi:hypothetical protein